MRKRIFLLPLIAIGFGLQAQSIGNSPYAAFGIGEVKYDNSVETSAMGGINTAYIWDFNNSFNFKNPAANTNLELTSIRVQATNENQFFKTVKSVLKINRLLIIHSVGFSTKTSICCEMRALFRIGLILCKT